MVSLRALVLRSPRPREALAWYGCALGIEGAGGRLVVGGAELRVVGDARMGRPAREPHRVVPTFVVADAGAAERRLVALGARWVRELQDTAWGRIATPLDPDGNAVQLLEPPSPGEEEGSP